MAAPGSLTTVVMALAGNAFVTAIKLIGFVLSGSGAMLSEAVHSAADTGNQVLLFLGLKRAAREPDDKFHYGYGGERFVFGMLSASGIFFIGCGVTVYHGISGLLSPHAPQLGIATVVILAASFVIEGGVLLFAIRAISRERGKVPFFRYVRESADPATVAILLEDGAAVLGLVLAALGILATYLTGNPMWDSIASIVVGVVLGVIAIDLVIQNRDLLLGKAVPDGVEDRFVEIVRRHPSVREVHDVKTRQLTPEAYKLKAELVMDEGYLARRLAPGLARPVGGAGGGAGGSAEGGGGGGDEATLRVLATLALHAVADEIASIERAVRAEIPQARHIDLEISRAATGAGATGAAGAAGAAG
ncbi:MAG TPA: cation diffusion facilitator family transporter [Kofleriaceae bacterium]|nr:cation diffusion facilitator family transporter [Kofleriaceae bacterium]